MSIILTKTLQIPEANTNDSYIDSGNPDTQYKTTATLKIGNDGTDKYRLLYDLTIGDGLIDPNVEIVSANLVFEVSSSSVTESQSLQAYRLDSQSGGENSSWNDEVAGGHHSTAWTTAGGDYDSLIGSSTTFTGASQTTVSFDVKSLLVDAIVNRGSDLRVLIGTTKELGGDVTGTETIDFHSSNASSESDSPKLVVRMRFEKNTTYTVTVRLKEREADSDDSIFSATYRDGGQQTVGLNTMVVGESGGDRWRSVLVGDLSWIPSSAKVSSADFTLKRKLISLGSTTSFTAAKLLNTNVTKDADWDYPNNTITTTTWSTPGGAYSSSLQMTADMTTSATKWVGTGDGAVSVMQDAIDTENSTLRLLIGHTNELNGSGSSSGNVTFWSPFAGINTAPTAEISFMLASTIIDVYLTDEDGNHVVDENGDRLIIGEVLVGSPMTDFEDLLEDLVLDEIIVGMKLAKSMPPGVNLRRFSISGDSFTGYRVTYNEHIFHGIFTTLETAVGAVAGTYARRGGWLLGSVLARPSLA